MVLSSGNGIGCRISLNKAGGKALRQLDGTIGLPWRRCAAIRGDRTLVEACHHGAAFDRQKVEQYGVRVCCNGIRKNPRLQYNALWTRPNASDSVEVKDTTLGVPIRHLP